MKTVLITVLIVATHATIINASNGLDEAETMLFNDESDSLKIYGDVNKFTGYRIIEEAQPVVTIEKKILISEMNNKSNDRLEFTEAISVYEHTTSEDLDEDLGKKVPRLLFTINRTEMFTFIPNKDKNIFELEISASEMPEEFIIRDLITRTDLKIGIGGNLDNSYVSCIFQHRDAQHVHIVIEVENIELNPEVLVTRVLSWEQFRNDHILNNIIYNSHHESNDSQFALFEENLLLPESLRGIQMVIPEADLTKIVDGEN